MTTLSSTRDLMKAVNAFMGSPKLPLTDELVAVIEGYLDKHEEYEQATSDRLQEELLATYGRSVEGQGILYYRSFLTVVRRLRPAIRSSAHVVQWWEKLAEPVLDGLSQDRGARAAVLRDVDKLLVYDEQDKESKEGAGGEAGHMPQCAITAQVMHKWMAACRRIQSIKDYNGEWVRDEPIHDVVIVLGKRRPMDFFNTLNTFFVQREYRIYSIVLLTELVRSQPPHLHLVIKSPFFDSLVRCLQLDTSTTVITLALTSLTMLLPNMPSSIVPVLPTLFNLYARALFWDREQQVPDDGAPTEQHASEPPWERCVFCPDNDDAAIPHLQLLGYYTVLYGLYPLNFMDYIRKPQRYLRHANSTDADDVEVQPSEMRDRSEQFRQCHLLHPNFYSLTIESEKTDFGRWRRSATADIVAECVGLRVPMEHGHEAASAAPAAVQAATAQRGSPSSSLSDSHAPDSASESLSMPPLLAQSASRTDLQGMIESNKAIKSRLYHAQRNDSAQSLSLSTHESVQERPYAKPAHMSPPAWPPSPMPNAVGPGGGPDGGGGGGDTETAAQMRRHIMLLKNDLSFERYMVQQHLAHIGALRRSNMKQVVTEAETQNLILVNRALKKRLDEAKKIETQVKKEAEMSRNRAKSWEESLANRVKKLREEQKRWSEEEAALRASLKSSQDECQRLMWLVCEKEVRELELEQDMKVLEAGEAERDRLHERVKRLAAAEQESRRLREELAAAQEAAAAAANRVELLQMQRAAREQECRQVHEYYERQVTSLNEQLAEARRGGGRAAASAGSLAETRALVESALAASRARGLELQKQQTRLTRQCRVLEARLLDQAAACDEAALSDVDPEPEPEAAGGARILSGGSSGGGSSSTIGGPPGYGQRLAADAAEAAPLPVARSISPQAERYYGRGGVQNSKKERKKKEDRDRRAGSGIRGIRGFV